MSLRGEHALLQLVARFCDRGGSSRGMRQFLSSRFFALAERNPQISFRAHRMPFRHPVLRAYYRNGVEHVVNVENKTAEQIEGAVHALRTQHGRRVAFYPKPVVRRRAQSSVQGRWTETFSLEGVDMSVEHVG